MSGYNYDFRGIKRKKNGFYSYEGFTKWSKWGDYYFSRNPLGDLVLKTRYGRQIVKNFSYEREKELNKIYKELSIARGKLGYIRYSRNSNNKNSCKWIEFNTGRQYKLGFEPLFQIKYGIIYNDTNEFIELDDETIEKYNLYGFSEEGVDLYDKLFEPYSHCL